LIVNNIIRALNVTVMCNVYKYNSRITFIIKNKKIEQIARI